MARRHTQGSSDSSAKAQSHASSARHELEMMFSPAQDNGPARPGLALSNRGHAPDVVFKRRRTVVIAAELPTHDGEDNEERAADTALDAPDSNRAPRIFRVAVAAPAPDSENGLDQASASSSQEVDRASDPLPPIPRRRPRRRATPGVVTFVARPEPQDAADGTTTGVSAVDPAAGFKPVGYAAPLVSTSASHSLQQRLQHLHTIVHQIGQAREFILVGGEAQQSYCRLRASIDKLMHQAEIARRAEAAKAVAWIKRAVAEYGLTPEELGLQI